MLPRRAARLRPQQPDTHDWDWRTLFPGSQYVDVVSVSYVNSFPGTADVDGFRERASRRNEGGAPEGIQGFLDFVRDVGLPSR